VKTNTAMAVKSVIDAICDVVQILGPSELGEFAERLTDVQATHLRDELQIIDHCIGQLLLILDEQHEI